MHGWWWPQSVPNNALLGYTQECVFEWGRRARSDEGELGVHAQVGTSSVATPGIDAQVVTSGVATAGIYVLDGMVIGRLDLACQGGVARAEEPHCKEGGGKKALLTEGSHRGLQDLICSASCSATHTEEARPFAV